MFSILCFTYLCDAMSLHIHQTPNIKNADEWLKIWSKKGVLGQAESLDDLLRADGYEAHGSRGSMPKMVAQRVMQELHKGDIVAELAAGAGPVMFMIKDLLKSSKNMTARDVSLTGYDYAAPLLQLGAQYARHLPLDDPAHNIEFFRGDIRNMDSVLDRSYNVVFLTGALHYLQDETAAGKAVQEMVRMTTRPGKVMVFDIQDKDLQAECEQARKDTNYEAHQQKTGAANNVHRNFVSRATILNAAKSSGCNVHIENTKDVLSVEMYVNAPCSYNAILECP